MTVRPARAPSVHLLALVLLVLLAIVGGAAAMIYRLVTATPGERETASSNMAAGFNGGVALPPPPPVEPVQYLDVAPDTARKINTAKPFVTTPVPPAAPVILSLAAPDQARAVDCLASAAWYEAGDDAVGEEAVIQVVLNRMRHRAFPKSVCGVVFQGSERSTGCQYSFTCDGALRRTPSAAAWARAQIYSRAALNGFVFARVGYATHYHTDWVVPKWNSGVEKVAAVDTHLFFRWPGANGSPAAFRERHAGTEPVIPALARLSPAHRPTETKPAEVAPDPITDGVAPPPPPPPPMVQPVEPATLRGTQLDRHDDAANLYVLTLKPDDFAGTLALVALDLCKRGGEKACTVVGFAGSAGRVVSGVKGQVTWPDRGPDFYFYRDPARGREFARWDCKTYPRPQRAQCMGDGFVAIR